MRSARSIHDLQASINDPAHSRLNCAVAANICAIQNIIVAIQNAFRESAVAVGQIQEMICWILNAIR
jgi:hypothetical protein